MQQAKQTGKGGTWTAVTRGLLLLWWQVGAMVGFRAEAGQDTELLLLSLQVSLALPPLPPPQGFKSASMKSAHVHV